MVIHALASEPHYFEHVAAIHKHLPDELRGTRLITKQVASRSASIDADDIFLIAGYWDYDRVAGHRVIYLEHGAGQAYRGDPDAPIARHPSYHGSTHPRDTIAFLAPRESVAQRWGDTPSFSMSGSPVTDGYAHTPMPVMLGEPVAVITFHWEPRLSHGCPEAGSAMDHWAEHLSTMVKHLRDQGFIVWGHHHPRNVRLPIMWRRIGVPVVDVAEVRRHAHLLIADNTSLMYEMAALTRPVVVLNAPWFRRHIHHGLRFWDGLPGIEVDDIDEFTSWNFRDYCRSDLARQMAEHGSRAAYDRPWSSGDVGFRAASWIRSLVE